MKTQLMTVAVGLAVVGFVLSPVSAQDANPPSASPPAPPAPPSADEAARFAAAQQKAKNDPTVVSLQQARESLDQQIQNAMNAAILAVDPSLAPTLQKVGESRERAKKMREGFDSLTPDQRQQLKGAFRVAQQDPEVIAAREKMNAAVKAMHEAMKAAIAKQKPELVSILDELGPGVFRGDRGPGGRGMGGPGGPRPDNGKEVAPPSP